MTLVLVEVANEAAVNALRHQQGVRVVGVVAESTTPPTEPEQTAPRKWGGALAEADAASLLAHAEQIRNEWERDMQ